MIDVQVIAGGGASDGAYAVLDVRARAGATIPPHVWSEGAGTLHVLSGEIEVGLNGDSRRLAAGEQAPLAAGKPSAIRAVDDSRVLCLAVPAGVERLAAIAGEPRLVPDDVAALLAGAGVSLLPR